MKLLAYAQNSPRALRYMPAGVYTGATLDICLDERGKVVTSPSPFIVGQTLRDTFEDISRNDAWRGQRMDLALNVRSYGLLDELRSLLTWHRINVVVYNVPGPELADYCATHVNVLGRLSEYEDQTIKADGVLVDCYNTVIRDRLLEKAHRAQRGPVYLISASVRDLVELKAAPSTVDYLITRRES